MKRNNDSLSLEVVEVPAENGWSDDMTDLVVELMVRKWIEEHNNNNLKEGVTYERRNKTIGPGREG